jgi:hypothetical protein
VHALEARPGGVLQKDMIAGTPEMVGVMTQTGRPSSHETRTSFVELGPYERLAISHIIDFLPGVKPYDNTITVQFFPLGDCVRMVVTLGPKHGEEFNRMSAMGFTSQFVKLDRPFGGHHSLGR